MTYTKSSLKSGATGQRSPLDAATGVRPPAAEKLPSEGWSSGAAALLSRKVIRSPSALTLSNLAPVAQTSSLSYRGFPIRQRRKVRTPCRLAAVAPERRFGAPRRRKVGDTAGWKPALLPLYEMRVRCSEDECAPTRNNTVVAVSRYARSALALSIFSLLAFTAASQPFQLPTANHALFENGHEEDFFVGTVGKPWTTGTFGCVRSDGNQLHEGLDIRCLQRDKHGEPTDSVMATADGTVAYSNTRPSLSNYGKYLVLRHRIEDIEVYSLYAHLHEIRQGLKTGQSVKAGEVIAIMGRTANTHEGISKDRAHVHFELNLLVNERFASWYKKNFPDQRDDHGIWNGQNLLGLDPRLILLQQHSEGAKFSLLDFIRHQNELCRVLIRKSDFPWVKRYSALIRQNPLLEKGTVAGYEVALNFNGIPFELTPRTASEIKGKAKFQLLSVNEAEDRKNPCRHLVARRGAHWELTNHGEELLEMLSY